MRKTQTVSGNPAYSLTLHICVTLKDFATALCDKAYKDKRLDFSSLTKTKAMEILQHSLQWHGRSGQYPNPDGVGETQDEYNDYYNKARAWVIENYPYLAPATLSYTWTTQEGLEELGKNNTKP